MMMIRRDCGVVVDERRIVEDGGGNQSGASSEVVEETVRPTTDHPASTALHRVEVEEVESWPQASTRDELTGG